MNIQEQLTECEAKILTLRQEISSLIDVSSGENTTELQKDKLNFLTVELNHLSNQVNMLKKQASEKSTPVTVPVKDFSMEFTESEADTPLPEIPLSKDMVANNAVESSGPAQSISQMPNPTTAKPAVQTPGNTVLPGTPAPRYIRIDQPTSSMASAGNNSSTMPVRNNQTANPMFSQTDANASATPTQGSVPNSRMAVPMYTAPKKDFESIFGKSWMAIFASVLIFISLIMLSAVMIPFLTDYIKVGIMFAFSIGLTVISCLMLNKNRDSKFLTALMGCGMGAIFISLLVTYIRFHMMNQFVLYGLIILWCIGAVFLSKYNSILFEIIGQIGISISLIMGLSSCASPQDISMLPLVCGFYILTTYVFYQVNHKKTGAEGNFSSVFLLIDAGILWFGENFMITFLNKNIHIVEHKNLFLLTTALSSLYIVILLVREYIIAQKESKARTIPVYVCSLLILLGNEILFHRLLYPEGGRQYLSCLYLILPLFLLVLEFRPLEPEQDDWVKGSTLITLLILSWYLSGSVLAIAVLALLCILATALTENSLYNIFSAVFAIMFAFFALVTPDIIYMSVVVLILLISCQFLLTGKMESSFNKCSAIFMVYVFISLLMGQLPIITDTLTHSQNTSITFILMSVITLIFLKTPITANWDTGEKQTFEYYMVCVIQVLLMFYGIVAMNAAKETPLKIATVLVAVILYAVRTEQTEQYKSFFDAFFVGRLTVLLIVILHVWNATHIFFSIPMLLEAIFFIVLGHIVGKKLYRVYGLVLSNFCLIKLLLLDISYKEDIQRALGFFICGVLCFVISFIYTRVEKIAAKKETD